MTTITAKIDTVAPDNIGYNYICDKCGCIARVGTRKNAIPLSCPNCRGTTNFKKIALQSMSVNVPIVVMEAIRQRIARRDSRQARKITNTEIGLEIQLALRDIVSTEMKE